MEKNGISGVVAAVAIEILSGSVLQADEVSAGRGRVIDWREVRSGETLMERADAFDVAYLFVSLVGREAAEEAVEAARCV